ncbi:MAG: DUF3267 domain-containing protein [Verrucomicrobiota bacterium]
MNDHAQVTKVRVRALTANLVCTLLLLVLCVAFIGLARLLPNYSSTESTRELVMLISSTIILFVAHELLHGFGLIWWAKVPRRHIRFGFLWRALVLYCHCTAMITVRDYRRMALLPLWITGGITLTFLLVFPADWLGLITGVALAACVGDVWMAVKLRRFPADWLVQDSPSEIGCDVISPVSETIAHAA